MADITREQVEEAIKGYIEPHLETDLVTAKSLKDIAIDGDKVKVEIVLGFPAKGIHDEIAEAVRSAAAEVDGGGKYSKCTTMVIAHASPGQEE